MDDSVKQMQERIKQKRKEVKKLSDEELMKLHEALFTEVEEDPDPEFVTVIKKEIDKRYISASWIWKRKSKPKEYQKWVDHEKKTEVMAARKVISKYSKYKDQESQDIVRKMEDRIKEISSQNYVA